ncbi:MAG: ATP synthase F1 subunit delta [Bacteroidetes bacterium]|nr:ATP synthase F1 subunit delta [Bacteroidota bacterium]MBS1628471.1 ATP synthase F1 subunit delta [Bacteroidota bacterium]
MQNPRLASRYAKSLIDLAQEQQSLEETLQDVQIIDATIRASREFGIMLRSPIIKADKKQAIFDAVLGGKIGTLTRAFVKLLTEKGREANLGEITTAFIGQYREMNNISMVKLITAVPVSEQVKENIRQKVAAAMPGKKVEMSTEVKAELIGGFVLEMGDKLVDASIRRDLADIRKQFLQNLYIQNIR